MKVLIVTLFLTTLLWLGLASTAAAATGACSVSAARDDVSAARSALRRAEARLAEARRVLAATEAYSSDYGSNVGRWVRLSRRVAWPWSAMPTLMFVIDRESNGDPAVYNWSGSGAAGLLQLMPLHYAGRFDPTVARANLAYGRKLYVGSGWAPWGF